MQHQFNEILKWSAATIPASSEHFRPKSHHSLHLHEAPLISVDLAQYIPENWQFSSLFCLVLCSDCYTGEKHWRPIDCSKLYFSGNFVEPFHWFPLCCVIWGELIWQAEIWNEYSLCRVRVESEYSKSQVESKYEYRPAVLEYESEYGALRYSSTDSSTELLDSSPDSSTSKVLEYSIYVFCGNVLV